MLGIKFATFAENFIMMTLQWHHRWTFSLGPLSW